jgi:hypothetical protein
MPDFEPAFDPLAAHTLNNEAFFASHIPPDARGATTEIASADVAPTTVTVIDTRPQA